MGTAHKIVAVILRMLELGSCGIVLGLLAKFFYALDLINGPTDSRLAYAISMASIGVVASLILIPPVKYSFYAFPLDLALFVCWIVCFALLVDLTGTRTCSSSWFNTYWTVYWNANSGNSVVVTGSVCAKWRAVLAFSFIVSFLWLASGFLGLYVCAEYYSLGPKTLRMARKLKPRKQQKDGDLEVNRQPESLPKVGQA